MLSSITIIAGCIWLISLSSSQLLSKVLLFIAIYLCGAYYQAKLGVYQIGLSYIIVYIGAIAILFLFIIMICTTTNASATSATPIFILLLQVPSYTKSTNLGSMSYLNNSLLDIQNISIYLFSGYFSIILIGVQLTACLTAQLDIL